MKLIFKTKPKNGPKLLKYKELHLKKRTQPG